MPSSRRRGRDSRCCNHVATPLEWRHFEDNSHQDIVELEEWLASLSPFARDHELGEIDELFEAAANGDLEDSGDQKTAIKPVTEVPEIFELRRTALTKKLRFYHGEPDELPYVLVALHRHIKTGVGSQNSALAFSISRYRLGSDSLWK